MLTKLNVLFLGLTVGGAAFATAGLASFLDSNTRPCRRGRHKQSNQIGFSLLNVL